MRTAEKLLRAEGCSESSEVSVLLVDDARIRELNRQYRGVDRATDVLAFQQEGDRTSRLVGPAEEDILGDVVISVETARRQAMERNKSLEDEVDLLLAHGLLHLLGYTDDTKKAARRMHERAVEVIGAEAAR